MVAPFIANILNADVAQVLRLTVVTSILVPVSLPALVKLLAGEEITIPMELMVRMLALVIFVPMGAVIIMRRFLPRVLNTLDARRFPISLMFFAVINLGVFSKYSSFFFENPGQLVVSVVIAYVTLRDLLPGGVRRRSRRRPTRQASGRDHHGSHEQRFGDSLFVKIFRAALPDARGHVHVSVLHHDRPGEAARGAYKTPFREGC